MIWFFVYFKFPSFSIKSTQLMKFPSNIDSKPLYFPSCISVVIFHEYFLLSPSLSIICFYFSKSFFIKLLISSWVKSFFSFSSFNSFSIIFSLSPSSNSFFDLAIFDFSYPDNLKLFSFFFNIFIIKYLISSGIFSSSFIFFNF